MKALSVDLATASGREIESSSLPAVLIDPRGDGPIRAERLGLEGLEACAARLAATCVPAPRRRARSPLLRRFVENKRVLNQVHRRLVALGDRRSLPGIDAEWLVDNFHIIADSLREVRHDLPPGYDELLPKLAAPPLLLGYPRVYALALVLVAHSDSELDEARITRFVRAFQQAAPLTIGELWALPTMLRLVLLENLRRLAERMIWGWEERRRAERWADEVLDRARARSLAAAGAAMLDDASGAESDSDEVAVPGAEAGTIPLAASALADSLPPSGALTDPFVVRLMQLLRDQDGAAEAFELLEAELDAKGTDPNEVLRREHHRQAANQVTVGNCVLSLRLLSAIDWNAFFEQGSRVESILREDPSGVYPLQDFSTSDRYRRTVETIARAADADEIEVARRAIDLARRPSGSEPGSGASARGGIANDSSASDDPRRGHVGYYLVDRGRQELEAAFGYRPGWRERAFGWVLDYPSASYFGAIAIVLTVLLVLAVPVGLGSSAGSWWTIPASLVLLLPLSELAVGLVNHVLTLLLPPRVLPKLAFKEGIPAEHATFIVIPGMLARVSSAAVLAERLETHYLSNPDPNLRFALLTDFADAPNETMPQDDELVRDALDRIRALNERYRDADRAGPGRPSAEKTAGDGAGLVDGVGNGDQPMDGHAARARLDQPDARGSDRFFLFHRRRIWNASQGCWMGWERKRGKLLEFNRLLRGARDTSYTTSSVELSDVPRVRYVITLDADTRMPRDAAGRLVGAMAHALNRPRFDPSTGRVVAGYGVLQPRISFHLTAATRSRFAALLATSGGIDPYSTAASDTYMDLFGVGTFTGKGIYDVDAFEAATGGAFPENHILSHDLIEGNFARCGLLTDTEMFDDFPARYNAYARREHRWVRGDWQLLPWLGPRVPVAGSSDHAGQKGEVSSATGEGAGSAVDTRPPRRPNPLPALERWKLLDNLRRSLVPPALLVLLAFGWTVLPGSPWAWTALALGVFALPLIQAALSIVIGSVRSASLAPLWKSRESLPAVFGQVAMEIVLLAYRSSVLVDAITRTISRLFVSRRRLLEWETAASTEQRLGTDLPHFIQGMWTGPALAVAIGLAALLLRPDALLVAAPLLAVWLLSPYGAYFLSRPRTVAHTVLTDAERRALRRVARKTWLFFETFVGDADHWLPPDNYQEIPDGRVAHRTSPTNMGLLLLSTLSASDLGYIGPRRLIERLEKTLETLKGLEKHWGHFYNWYQTETLQPLPPKYISTVDSGNFLGCLIALAHGLREKAVVPLADASGIPVAIDGLADTFGLVAEDASVVGLSELRDLIEHPRDHLIGWDGWLQDVERVARRSAGRSLELAGPDSTPRTNWAGRLADLAAAWRSELNDFVPWLEPLRTLTEKGEPAFRSEAARARWDAASHALAMPGSLTSIVDRADRLAAELDALAGEAADPAAVDALRAAARAVRDPRAAELLTRLHRLADAAEAMADGMDFRPLYRPDRHLFAIGYNLVHGRHDNACYDLMASECCLTSYLAVARGEAPRRHWFQLGRPFIRAADRIGLISWGGTMFEYLMPRLLLRTLPGTLLAEACRTAVARQIEYGHELGLPWGISESGFAAQYLDGDYQYQAFGTPGLGLKQGLEQDRVIAPYATAMATMLAPREALENLRRLTQEGAEGEYGYYEAVDYTPERLPKGKRSVIVRSHMAHHQGMSLVALNNTLHADVMTHRFGAEPMIKAIDLLLEERVPVDVPIVDTFTADRATATSTSSDRGDDGGASGAEADSSAAPMSRRLTTPFTPVPRTHLLSNTQYHVVLTNAGSGVSTCRGLDMTRWREDAAREGCGQFVYVRDLGRGVVWSAGFQPVCRVPESYEVIFAADKATFRRRDLGIETVLEVIVSPEHRAEVRRITLVNHDPTPREIELTSYAEIVLTFRGADLGHPAFAKLFLETEWLAEPGAIVCRRRMRSASEQPLWAMHVSAIDRSTRGSTVLGDIQFETDRARFLGRGRTVASPAALDSGAALSGTAGPVLDPIVSLRRRLRIDPGGTAVVSLVTAFAESRDEALALADQFREPTGASRAFELAWAHSQVEHRHHGTGEAAHLYQRLASHILFTGGALRAEASTIARNRLGQSALWRFGISGDRPIVLARIAEGGELPLVRQLIAAHAYLRPRGLEFDLVLLDEEHGSYLDELNRQLLDAVRGGGGAERIDQPGGIFVRKASQMSEDEHILLEAAARVVLVGERSPLAGQLDRTERHAPLPGRLTPTREPGGWSDEPVGLPEELLFANGTGGFTRDGREYCVLVHGAAVPERGRNGPPSHHHPAPPPVLKFPPAPWVNVVANPACGFVISEAGSGFTWAVNSQANRLTPWSNDPVSDPPGEVIYLRDEETGEFWSVTPLPVPSSEPTLVRHGQGYTTFARNTHGLSHELTLLVPPDDPVKLLRLVIRNAAERPRRVSAMFYAEWVLGLNRDVSSMHVVTEVDEETGALLARNAFRADFSGRVAFADVDRRPRTVSGDRMAFVGRHGSLANPATMARQDLVDRVGAAIDPCAAIHTGLELRPGADVEVVFLIGEADDLDAARTLVGRYREPGAATRALEAVKAGWEHRLGTVQVRTPDPAVDLLANRWLLYQVLACRYWARSGFYQSGGAYGFRDQLQDVMALVHAAPEIAREHILRAASHQFLEGDVQHWWHPPVGRGIRTRISDDPAWLAFVVGHYVEATGDTAILDEPVDYLEAPPLEPDQEDNYGLAPPANRPRPVYEHCVLGLERVDHRGAHGLPLMGHGDWNDGMNHVGAGGRGESVWLAWFAIAAMRRFATIARARGDTARSDDLTRRAAELALACETSAWDGDWYRRAYFDDGTPLGSASNDACRIDSLAQSWAVLCGAADPERARKAMESANTHLVDRDGRLIRLFTPPFDAEPIDPGYIKGYLPGIRENGGQYTHGATWVVQAYAALGQGRMAAELLEILNPIRHAQDPQGVERYKVEPYVIAGDVYSRPPHVGRGGWTWYTGSASWLYRTITEAILGFHRHGDRLTIDPRIPPDWPGYEIVYRFGSSTYRIAVENPNGRESGTIAAWLDGEALGGPEIPLADTGGEHHVRVVIQ